MFRAFAGTCDAPHLSLIIRYDEVSEHSPKHQKVKSNPLSNSCNRVPEVGKNMSVFLPGEHSLVHQHHPLATNGECPPGVHIPDSCPIGGVCGKVQYTGTNYLLGECRISPCAHLISSKGIHLRMPDEWNPMNPSKGQASIIPT
jgi:hypothetical protein